MDEKKLEDELKLFHTLFPASVDNIIEVAAVISGLQNESRLIFTVIEKVSFTFYVLLHFLILIILSTLYFF